MKSAAKLQIIFSVTNSYHIVFLPTKQTTDTSVLPQLTKWQTEDKSGGRGRGCKKVRGKREQKAIALLSFCNN